MNNKQLILIRHAKSSWNQPNLSDFDRPLNERGERDAPVMGKRLLERGIRPNALVSSPAKRAFSTACVIAEALGFPPQQIRTEPRIYEATVGTLLAIIQALENRHQQVLLFGHNPSMSELSRYLSGESLEELPTCGVFALQFTLKIGQIFNLTAGSAGFMIILKNIAKL